MSFKVEANTGADKNFASRTICDSENVIDTNIAAIAIKNSGRSFVRATSNHFGSEAATSNGPAIETIPSQRQGNCVSWSALTEFQIGSVNCVAITRQKVTSIRIARSCF